MAIGKQSKMCRLGVLLFVVSCASSDAAMGQSPPLERASVPLRRFTAKYFQPANPGLTPGGAVMRTDSAAPDCDELHRRVSNALAEAAEILAVSDLPIDVKCPVWLQLQLKGGCVQPWVRERVAGESPEEFEARRKSSRIANRYDYEQIQQAGKGVHVKVVDEVDYCLNVKGEVIGGMETTPPYGCALPDRTFIVKRSLLPDMNKRAVVFAHEYGHNAGNYDQTGDPAMVMGGVAQEWPAISLQRVVSEAECKRYQSFTAQYEQKRATPAGRAAKKGGGAKRPASTPSGSRKKG